MTRRRALAAAAALCALAAAGLFAEQAWLAAKAWLAERLIERAFAAHLADGGNHSPWGWADTSPVARLEVPRLGVRRHVLSGAGGSALAFGPGHLAGTPLPGAPGNAVIAGHRDGAFRFLRRLRPGDTLRVRRHGGTFTFAVRETRVVEETDLSVLEPGAERSLTLITCWPFDGWRGLTRGGRRYVVRAELTASCRASPAPPAARRPGRAGWRPSAGPACSRA